ncbi:hypothetical protein [Staphylococcus haemolyticus]|jgi:hypothetical protein|uniref:hypothetical protein n=1 Tax=Staphylococcus haemolyticus TaxID=1283 RepID=UPI0015D7B0C2|nr:hypothetical protein [Staphylococcus haemolyticus]
MTTTFVIYTQYDGKDYRSVEQVCYYDEDGEEQVDEALTALCMDISTCADQGVDTWSYIKNQVSIRLKAKGIQFDDIEFQG